MGLTELEKAYIAGFFDGEGCVNLSCRNKKNGAIVSEITIEISNNDYEVMKFIHKLVGGTIYKRYDLKHPHTLRLYAGNAAKFLTTILPYLVTKKRQAQLGIEFQKLIHHRGKKVTNMEDRLALVASIKAERDSINKKISILGGN